MSDPTDVRDHRLERVREQLVERGLEALWVEPSVELTYLTGLRPVSIERLFALVIPATGDLRMVVPLLLRDECEHVVAEHFVWDDGEGPEGAVERVLKGISRLWVLGSLPYWALQAIRSARPDVEIEADPGVLADLREKKDETEIGWIRRSGKLTDETVEWVGTLDLETMTERELGGRLQAHYLELGYAPSPYGLVASGANAAMPHYVGDDVRIRTDAPLLLDFGAAVEGYWSDITRIYFPHDLDREIEDAYDVVCRAYDAAFGILEVGITCHEVDRAAREVIDRAGHGNHFIHRTGHGWAWKSTSRRTCEPETSRRWRSGMCSASSRASTYRGASACATRTSCISARTAPSP